MPKEERYHCNTCNKSYSVTVGTMFHKTKVDLQKWFYAISLIANNENISARQLGKEIDVTKDTAWFMMKRIKESLQEGGGEIPEPERANTPEPPM